MMDYGLKDRRIFLQDSSERKEIELFLNNEGIKLDKNLDYTVGVYDSKELVATGSFFKNTLRCLAVNSEYQGLGVTNKVVSHLMTEQYSRGYTDIFLYTKCSTAKFFNNTGFYEVARVEDAVVLMENKFKGIQEYAMNLSKKRVDGARVASIVINANPFTFGHQYLVEKVSSENDVVHVFVVSEDASIVPFSVRYELVKRGTSHLKNVVLHKAGNYIISGATFPSYFIKDGKAVVSTHAKLDLQIFRKYIGPALGINRRYVGEEPYCEVTRKYNEIMKSTLEEEGIECRVVPRLELEGKAVSASRVRAYIKEGQIDKIKELVPSSTYEYFKSRAAAGLIEKIKNNTGRH
ncbi:[citrate (pro-3S)-lyase] ligase [Clostridium magnum]|uniref:[Citrate [pro-3S]-lyase] ligase n=1 Tax=Clostridium magnum DSM 2767 TaxID=1121326 RepID=A0A161YK85_9CLOT|nr:[citrate [pro-3S]-lyase] ligase [Clostridium magnum DSM 2767]SHJ37885.1 [citrate (pro-3S)-lyase] ligase [Clostridium magnum DSM 2767]